MCNRVNTKKAVFSLNVPISNLAIIGDDSESGVVADWSSEVAREEGRQSGYLTDSVLSRGRGGYRGRSRRGRGGYSSGRNSGTVFIRL